MRPGEVIAASGSITLNAGRDTTTLTVTNTSKRPVRVSSHYPFWLTNPRLAFDRAAAKGRRLDIPAGRTVRWAAGETREVALVRIDGTAGREG